MTGAKDILQGVQFLISKWEMNELPADTVLALIEVHLERESLLARPSKPFILEEVPQEFHTITQG